MSAPPQASPRFPFARAMAFGLGALRLPPDAFWAMSLPELRAAARGIFGEASTPFDRAALDALMKAHPDRPGGAR